MPQPVRHFRQILIWPLQVMPIREGAQIQEPWDILKSSESEHPWREVQDEFGCAPDDFQERHFSEFVTFLPYVRRFLYGEGQSGGGTPKGGAESPLRVFRRSDIAKVRMTFPEPGSEPETFSVAHVDLYFLYDIDVVLLVVEIFADDLSLSRVQDTMYRFGRAYPTYWAAGGRGGHCVTLAEWLTFFVIRYAWNYPLWLCAAATSIFFLVDFAFLSSNLLKLVAGGWFPLLIGGVIFTLMTTWQEGRSLLNEKLRSDAMDIRSFLQSVLAYPPARVAGTAVFLTAESGTVPNALLHNLKHNKVFHEHNVFVTVRNHGVPWITADKRMEVHPLENDCWQVVLHYGFKDDPDVPLALEHLREHGCDHEVMTTSYFLSREVVVPTLGEGMAPWREKLFAEMHHNASAAADFLRLPSNAVVELGSKVEI